MKWKRHYFFNQIETGSWLKKTRSSRTRRNRDDQKNSFDSDRSVSALGKPATDCTQHDMTLFIATQRLG